MHMHAPVEAPMHRRARPGLKGGVRPTKKLRGCVVERMPGDSANESLIQPGIQKFPAFFRGGECNAAVRSKQHFNALPIPEYFMLKLLKVLRSSANAFKYCVCACNIFLADKCTNHRMMNDPDRNSISLLRQTKFCVASDSANSNVTVSRM